MPITTDAKSAVIGTNVYSRTLADHESATLYIAVRAYSLILSDNTL